MNWDTIEGQWQQLTGKVKEQWGKLTDDDIARINGKREALAGRLQEAYGVARDEAESMIEEWEDAQPEQETQRAPGIRREKSRQSQ